jgi:hypothetical protein
MDTHFMKLCYFRPQGRIKASYTFSICMRSLYRTYRKRTLSVRPSGAFQVSVMESLSVLSVWVAAD